MEFLPELFTGLVGLIDASQIQAIGESLFQTEFARMTMIFGLAFWMVKKEVKKYFESITNAINNLTEKLSTEMFGIKGEIKKLTSRVDHIESMMVNHKKEQ